MNNKQKRALIKFFIAGGAALLIDKIKDIIIDKSEEYFPDDEPDQEDN